MEDFGSGITLNCYMNKFVYIKPTQLDMFRNGDYHIYFICSIPKSYFVENSIRFSAKNLKCEIVQGGETVKIENSCLKIFEDGVISGTSFRLSNDKSVLTLLYYKDFTKQKDITLTANEVYGASGLMKFKREKVLYIGESWGKKRSRTSAERLINHQTLQKILADNQTCGGDEEINLYLMNFKMEHVLQLSGFDKQTNSAKTAEKFFDTMNSYNQKMCIDLVEACLINYFKPQYNTQYKDKILSKNSKKFNFFYEYGVSRISVQILPDKYESPDLPKKTFDSLPQIIFFTDNVSYDTSNYRDFIISDLDEALYSTYTQLKSI